MSPPNENPLLQSVQFLPGGGPHRAELLEKLGIHTALDLLWHLPRDLLDLTEVRQPQQLVDDEVQTVRGVVVESDARQLSKGRTLTASLIDCGTDFVRGVWFNQPWMRQRLQPGHNVLFSGKPKRSQGRWEFPHPRIQWLDPEDRESHGGLLPKYPLTEGISQGELRRLTRHCAEQFAALVPERLTDDLRQRCSLPTIGDALRGLHAPRSRADYDAGRRRLLFEDLLEFQLALALRKRAWNRQAAAPALPTTAQIDARIRRLFAFRFTDGQNQAIRDVASDLASGHAMHRLLQAEVGAGKTAVAIYALLVAVANGFQAVLMAPTELLANQHWDTIDALLANSRVSRLLLTGTLTAAERREAHARIEVGEVQLVVGTQAVIQENVRFPRLALAVVDEQHRFGVAQRAGFARDEVMPHILVMTATPIPRSLCLTLFGDLDLTMIRDLPPGRRPVMTQRITSREQQQRAWDFLRKQLKAGRQAYVVCPRVETESPTARDAAATKVYEYLQRTELSDFRLGLAHGQMDRRERAEIMDRFRDGELDGLVATTVVEVGVDVPNATLMVILQAERFGLAQLHQLRGRVARGSHQGYCFLFSEATAEDAIERLGALEATSDGFSIAEKDFELRGPGDVLGTRQHGDLPLKVANPLHDAAILEEARPIAFELVNSGTLDSPEFAPLKLHVLERFASLFDLPQTG
ncbi:MAG: ATP-dependent DNA helicase RecG [Planctomycetaceae bacterium]|nr:ATP-dependent DNA helicase RecG [Planctomycetaceae bacterium]